MRLLKQTRLRNCGQTCVAMIAGISIEEAEKAVGKKGSTFADDLIVGLNKLGITTKKLTRFAGNHLIPKTALLLCTKSSDPKWKHWAILHKGQFFDPNEWVSFDKITSFIEVDI